MSTVITGASNPDQVKHNMHALEVVPRLELEVLARMQAVVGEGFD